MIKFRNPGSSIETQVQIMKLLYRSFDQAIFGLADIATVLATSNMMTAYGYAGDAALKLSDVSDTSRNSTMMNAKMYAEIFRVLGWLSSYENDKSYPVVITELGRYVACAPKPLALYEECLLGICSPQEMMRGVRYDEKVRAFKCILETLNELDDIMYKHEICMGPMSVNDVDPSEFKRMLQSLRDIRGDYSKYEESWNSFCADLGMKPTSVDNQTRFPVGALKGVGWAETERSKKVYPPKTLVCLKITSKGKERLSEIAKMKDVRLEDYKACTDAEKQALIRLGFYTMLKRAGYDTSPVETEMEQDADLLSRMLEGKQPLFSPYQLISNEEVSTALGIDCDSYIRIDDKREAKSIKVERNIEKRKTLTLTSAAMATTKRGGSVEEEIINQIITLSANGITQTKIIEELGNKYARANQDVFYPLVGAMFRILGFDCIVSRQGDNGSRWDSIIVAPGNAIPIEIKSPGEEEYISIKAVKQAAENKVILLARKPYPTDWETTTLVVGYKAPNERAEVDALVDAFESAYAIRVGVIPFDVLSTIVVKRVLEDKTVSPEELGALKGIANA